AGDGGCPGDVLVGAVGAGSDEGGRDVEGPALLAGGVADLGELVGPVGGVGAVDHGAELVQVDLDDLVEVGAGVGVDVGVGPQVLDHGVGGVGDLLAARGPQVVGHVLVVGEQRGGGSEIGRASCREGRGVSGGARTVTLR